MSPKVLVAGAGALGICYMHVLQKAGADVTALCRSNYEEAKKNGFTINSTLWGNNLKLRCNIVQSAKEAGQDFDYIFVTAKAWPETHEMIADAVAPARSKIVLVQNGILIEEAYRKAYPDNVVISGSCNIVCNQVQPGLVKMGQIENLALGYYPAAEVDQHLTNLVHLLKDGGSNATASDDIQVQRFTKVMHNAAYNPIGALTRLSVPHMMHDEHVRACCRQQMLDVVSIANAEGYNHLSINDVDASIARISASSIDKSIESSMLTDVRWGRPLETWAIVGNLLTLADKHKLAVSCLRTTFLLTSGLNAAIRIGSLEQSTSKALGFSGTSKV